MALPTPHRVFNVRQQTPRGIPSALQFCGVLILVIALSGLSGCFLDFDQFEPGDTPDGGGADTDITDAGDTVGDTEMDVGPDGQTPVEVEIGANCSADSDCGAEGVCRSGYCTAACGAQSPCPAGSSCRSLGSERLCVLDCAAYDTCDGVSSRGDLTCASGLERGNFGALRSVYKGCIPDSDGDQVMDHLDNCPDAANGMQTDRDADGMGDACDSDPICHSAATDGVVDYGTITYAAQGFAVPASASHGWMPIAGGTDSDGAALADFAILDRDSKGWTSGTLPYIPDGLVVGPGPYDEYVATPGVIDEQGEQIGPHMVFERGGSVSFGERFSTAYPADFLAGARFGIAYAFGRTSPGSTSSRAMKYNASARTYSTLGLGFTAPESVEWMPSQDLEGDLVVYSGPDPTSGDATIKSVTYTGISKLDLNITLPMASTGQYFDPVVLPGLGGVFYVFDRTSGESAIINTETGAVDRTPELDLSLDDTVTHVIPSPESASLIVLSRPSVDGDELAAREIFIRCPGAVAERDSDGDGAIDTQDNCPNSSNSSQLDTDRDGVGDSCDQDVDGDGIPNPSDQVPSEDGSRFIGLDLDSDNDRIDNPDDEDDDNDGIPDSSDRFPLDTDNDGFWNAIDSDDDADGFDDSIEQGSDTNQFDQFDFPNAGAIAFIEEDDAGTRTVKVGVLSDLSNAVARPVSSSGSSPSRLSLTDNGEDLIVLDGAPEQTQQFRVGPVDTNTGRSASSWQVGTSLRDVALLPSDVTSGTVSEATVVTETAEGWSLVRLGFNPQSEAILVEDLTNVLEVAAGDSYLGLIGAPADCPGCIGVYRFDPSATSQATFLANNILNPRSPVVYQSTVFVVGDRDDGTSSAFGVSQNSTTEIRPPLVEQVDSIAVGLGGGVNHLLLSGSTAEGDPNDLYFFNRTRGQWYKILTTSTDLVDISWTSRSPSLEDPEQ